MLDTSESLMSVAPVVQWLDEQQHTLSVETRVFTWSDATLTIQVHPHGRVEILKIYNLSHTSGDGTVFPQHGRGRFRELMESIKALPWTREIWFAQVVGERLCAILIRHGYERFDDDFRMVLRGDPDAETKARIEQQRYEHRPIEFYIGLDAAYWPAGWSAANVEEMAYKLKSQLDERFHDTRTELDQLGDRACGVTISFNGIMQRFYRSYRGWRVESFYRRAKSVALEATFSKSRHL